MAYAAAPQGPSFCVLRVLRVRFLPRQSFRVPGRAVIAQFAQRKMRSAICNIF